MNNVTSLMHVIIVLNVMIMFKIIPNVYAQTL